MERDKQQSHGLSNGFLLGVIVGVVITLLLTTKRGKKILKMITEEGMNRFSNLDEMFSDAMEERREQAHSATSGQAAAPKLPPVEMHEPEEEEMELEASEDAIEKAFQPEPHHHAVKAKASEPKSPKRFFKGIPRRSVN